MIFVGTEYEDAVIQNSQSLKQLRDVRQGVLEYALLIDGLLLANWMLYVL